MCMSWNIKEITVYMKKTELDMSLKLMTNGWAFRIRIMAKTGIFLCASTFKTCLEHIEASYRWVMLSELSR
jgi:hypothetical protein